MRVVATAGHVDHGKSTLVRALTGTDPDRFPEEKERGLTIDLGFAFCELPSGRRVGFVDVPGHMRFVKNMLAGVGAVDVALLVVAANEGWMPQTEEHAQILARLDVRHGVVALTKASLVDDDRLAFLQLELAERVDWPVVVVDALLGRGLDALRLTLDAALCAAKEPRDCGRPRLWVDRAFAVKGAGTVVTGTLTDGAFSRGDEVVVEPGGRRARLRRIEAQHESLERVAPGGRVALNLAGIDHALVRRGMAVVSPGQWALVDTLDVALRIVPGEAVPAHVRVDAHVGTAEHLARLRRLDDHGHFARLRLASPLPLAPGDRFVLRSSAAQTTIAGAEVLDVAPAARTADAVERLRRPLAERVLATRPWCTRAEMARVGGDEHAADGYALDLGTWLAAPATVAAVRSRTTEMAGSAQSGRALLSVVAAACRIDTDRLRACLAADPTLSIEGETVRTADRPAVLEDPVARRFLAALGTSPLAPPAPADLGVPLSIVRALMGCGAIVELDGVVFSAAALDDARTRITRLVLDNDAVTLADVRGALDTTRKFTLAIVNRMDAEGVTRRRGDRRVAGPRARRS
jgi:selenocysteine-specific elongation factor